LIGKTRNKKNMSEHILIQDQVGGGLLRPIECISEMVFGLFMALTFVAALAAITSGNAELRTMFVAALSCNLAWGLVDAIMYLVRTATDRGPSVAFTRAVQAASDASNGRRLVDHRLHERFLLRTASKLISATKIEAIRAATSASPHTA